MRYLAVVEYMKHQACLYEVSMSPQLVNCTKTLNEYFAIIFNRKSRSAAEKDNDTLLACQFVLPFTRQFSSTYSAIYQELLKDFIDLVVICKFSLILKCLCILNVFL